MRHTLSLPQTLPLSLTHTHLLPKAFPLWWVRVIIILMASQSDANSPNGEAGDGGGRREEKRKRTKLDLHFLFEKYVMGSGKRMMMMCAYDSFVCLSAFIFSYSHYSLSLSLSLLSD